MQFKTNRSPFDERLYKGSIILEVCVEHLNEMVGIFTPPLTDDATFKSKTKSHNGKISCGSLLGPRASLPKLWHWHISLGRCHDGLVSHTTGCFLMEMCH